MLEVAMARTAAQQQEQRRTLIAFLSYRPISAEEAASWVPRASLARLGGRRPQTEGYFVPRVCAHVDRLSQHLLRNIRPALQRLAPEIRTAVWEVLHEGREASALALQLGLPVRKGTGMIEARVATGVDQLVELLWSDDGHPCAVAERTQRHPAPADADAGCGGEDGGDGVRRL